MQPYLTIEETISIPRLSRLAVSEDGARLAWVETVANWDKNEYCLLYTSFRPPAFDEHIN